MSTEKFGGEIRHTQSARVDQETMDLLTGQQDTERQLLEDEAGKGSYAAWKELERRGQWPPRARELTSADPQPPIGAVVVDVDGTVWRRTPPNPEIKGRPRDWIMVDINGDPETWTRVAGNYGPVQRVWHR